MSGGILSDLTNLYNALKYLDDLRKVVQGNKTRCHLLIDRCKLFSEKISLLLTNASQLSCTNRDGVMRLLATVQRCTDFVTKYGKKGWKRMCQNIAYASSIETEFLELNNALLNASSDLQFFILVEQTVQEEDRRANEMDIVEIMNTLMEESQKSGQSSAEILALSYAQLDQLKQVNQLINIVPALQSFLDRSNSILSLAESSSSLSTTTTSSPSPTPAAANNKPSTKESMKLLLRFSEIDLSLLDPIKTVIGRGQYGVVYSCRYNHRAMALKEFQSIGQLSNEMLCKIQREAAIMSLLRHKNIVSFEGFSLSDGIIIMELAHCSLFSLLHNSDKVSVPPLEVPSFLHHLMICEDIVNGLRYLHFHNIQHRDIKSANILLFLDSSRSNKVVAKISDFGIAFMVGSTATSSSYTSAVGGTLAYMAPELLCIEDDDEDDTELDSSQKEKNESAFCFSFSSDIYAVGVLFNEIVTGKVPWSNLAHNSLIQPRVAKGKRPTLYKPSSSDDVGAEKQLIDLIGSSKTGCLSQNPAHRPSAAILHQEISKLVEDQQHDYDDRAYIDDSKDNSALSVEGISLGVSSSLSIPEEPIAATSLDLAKSSPVLEKQLMDDPKHFARHDAAHQPSAAIISKELSKLEEEVDDHSAVVSQVAYSIQSKKNGRTYYLHTREQVVGSHKFQLYYFASKIMEDEALKAVPDGYEVLENERTGLPAVKKRK